ncbi:MetQ/NlpA family ABC transporter substrate-binding protein [Gulosibacter molinativorax]|uniref:Methionine ABC transporter substrate-binding protein n=1 Tax=Gulosibacter molinativorax TaxID=256821 RepID=A0ABT7C8Z7_9MICO|nr:MetQ/NlpA family ABC transporter substrate-binding protein [Gulosibacter molinativorax]MDJ1371660.1 methionine ABC transporter substrate-binding protein [Gulosibacter molinativorax]QUY63082.1 D-methionine-binding lipoprotein MetQ [Gulosibacter molinativorax]
MARITKVLAAAGAIALLGSLAACSNNTTPQAGESGAAAAGETIKLGVVGASEPYWATYEAAVEAEGIDLEIIDFGDYNQPNPALSAGELDINQFQHIIYLAEHNNASGDTLTVIGSTAIYPLGLYSTKHDSVESIPEGGKVGVPNDTTNQARGLLVLQSAGLIKLKDGGSPYSTLDDIIAEESKVEVQAFNADLIPASLPDLDAGIINNDFVADAGLTEDDAIAQDDPADPAAQGYVNVFAVREEDKTNETLLKLVEIYQTNEDVQQGVIDASGGTAEMLVIAPEELQASLEKIQSEQP